MTDPQHLSQDQGPPPGASAPDAQRPEGRGEGPRNREPRLVTPRGTPVGRVKVTLHTDFAQRVFRRCWDRLKGDLYVLTVRTRMADQNQTSAAIETVISEAFNKARTDLAADLERTEVLRDHAQVSEFPEYVDRLEAVATFSTPRAREFLSLIQQMDQLLMLYDALWLQGFAETDERVHRSQNWQRRLIKVANRLRELANRTRVSLARQSERPNEGEGAASGAAAAPALETVASEEGLGGVPHDAGAMEAGASEDEGTGEGGVEGDAELGELDEGLNGHGFDPGDLPETPSPTAAVAVTPRLSGRRVSSKSAAAAPVGKSDGSTLAGPDAIAAGG